MQFLHIVSALAVGGIVGCVTNYIAIKMLFRPYKPVMLGSFRVPFTPGIVPKRKDALAEILGRAVVDRFFNADDLEVVFQSDAMADAFADAVTALLSDEHFKLGDIRECGGEDGGRLYSRLRDELCIRIQAAVLRSELSRRLVEDGLSAILNRLGDSALGKLTRNEIASSVTGPLTDRLERYVLQEGRAVLLPILDDELSALAALPAAELTAGLFPGRESLHQIAYRLHRQFMGRYVRTIVESIDVGGMITDKVRQMTAGEVERLVLTVVNRELRLVVLLGALIGMLIGAINIFI